MISSRVISHANIFELAANVHNVSKISLPIADHNAPLVGDELSTVTLNYQWRRILVHAAEHMLDREIYDGTEAEIDTVIQQAHALLSDMYTFEDAGMDYLGARVGSTVTVNIPVTYAEQSMLGVIGSGMHDIGGFWDAGASEKLTVPVGGAGYYYCVADAQVDSHSAKAWMNIRKNASVILNDIIVTPNDARTKSVSSVAFFDDGDFLDFQIRAATTGRKLFVRTAQPYTKQLTMYRVGIAP